MRRVIALLICVFLLAVPVHAANTAPRVTTTAVVTENGSCQVTVEAEIRLETPAKNLKFPLGTNIHSVTLNGSNASTITEEGITSVDLSHLDGKTGLYACTIIYSINSVVSVDEDGRQIVTVPVLYGFPYPVENMSFTVTMPTDFDTVPTFLSGYHGQDIERQMVTSVNGNVIQGRLEQELKDSETLFLKLVASEDMFPASQTFGGSMTFDAIAMGICAALAFAFWLLTMRCLPRLSWRRATAPEGVSAGLVGTYLVRRDADLSVMIIQWAQLGYLIIHLDDNGRVFLHKKMDMGNERSVFEQRCFRNVFGNKNMIDATGYRFHNAWSKTASLSRRQSFSFKTPLSCVKIFRLIGCLVGMFAGIAMGDAVATSHTWRYVLMAAGGLFGFGASWGIQEGMFCLHLRCKSPLKLSLLICCVFLLSSYLSGCIAYGAAAVIWCFISGLMAAYGGIRGSNGQRIFTEILGLRRHMRKCDRNELKRILASNRNYYYELAPYALAMGVDKTFAERFGDARLPACTWLVSKTDDRRASDWYTKLRECIRAMNRERKPTLAERLFGK